MAAKYPQKEHEATSSVSHSPLPSTKIKSLLSEAVNQILTPWPALVMAIENSFGGPDTREKGTWMKSVLVDYIVSKKSIELDELEDFILNIMETEFNTMIEDGSCSKLSGILLRVYRAVQLNDTREVEQVLSPFRLLAKHPDKECKSSSISHSETPEHLGDDRISEQLYEPTRKEEIPQHILPPQEMELSTPEGSSENKPDSEAPEDMDTGGEWEIVTRSRKKKKSSSYLSKPNIV